MKKRTKDLSWPSKPKFIFTSNSFDTDEIFKLWTAKKVESGSKYIVGQHGNNYGTHRYIAPSVEETTADKFLTWGWTDSLPQHVPAFVFTQVHRDQNYNPKGQLLLVELPLNHRINSWDTVAEFGRYFQEQQRFVEKLADSAKKRLVIRLHSASRYQNWSEEARWVDMDSSLKLDAGTIAIRKEIARSRLVVHSYDSTGMLETLYQNIPTIAFWQNGYDHLRDNVKQYYDLLVEAEIVHLTAESAAQKVNAVWDDIDGWWKLAQVQRARRQFCDLYARHEDAPISKLMELVR